MDVPHEQVWAALADLASHDRWMKDALGIEFESEQRRGPGTAAFEQLSCPDRKPAAAFRYGSKPRLS